MTYPPNILFITTDHLRFDTLGCNGDPIIQTPVIDKLASQSFCFQNYFVQNPVCMPSRATFLTGRYPRHHGVTWNSNRLPEYEVTMPQFFKTKGYTTAMIGKHHVSQQKFKESFDYMTANHCRRNWNKRPNGDYTVSDPNEFEQYVRNRGYEYITGYALPDFRKNLGAVPSDLPEDCHIDAYVGMKTQEYIRDKLNTKSPFFLWLGFYGPHHPYVPSGRFANMYNPRQVPDFHKREGDIEKKPIEYTLYFQAHDHKYHGFPDASDDTFRKMKAAYYGMVSQIDWALGGVLEELEKKGLKENTIVAFTSDHGEFLGDHGIPAKAPFLLDCMLHVPCFIRVPNKTKGEKIEDLAEEVDLFPTLARLAGFDFPQAVQGKDLSPLVVDQTRESYSPRQVVYAEAVDKKSIRTHDWKYIHYPDKNYGELYDIKNDPPELNNLHSEKPDKVVEMKLKLLETLDATEEFHHPTYHRFSGKDPKTGKEITHYHTW